VAHRRDAPEWRQSKVLFALHVGKVIHAVGRERVLDALLLAGDACSTNPIGDVEADDLKRSHN
jgi:hypothetical protein